MNNSEEVKDIAIIYKLKRNYGTLEYVPYKVVIGTYDGEEEELIDEHGTPYHHIIEGNTYGFAARKSLAEYNKQFPLLPPVVIKALILHFAKKYKYKLNQFSDECTPMINFYDKEKYSKESILLDRDILVFYITYYPEVLSEIEEEFGIKITYEKQIEEPKNENQTKLQVTNKEKENKIDINVNKLYTEITKNVIDQNEPIKKILTAIWKQYNNFSTNKSRNILINGSTGVGKTEIFRQLTKNVNIPCYIANATEYTASGYVGRDVSEMLKSLLDITNGDLEKAEKGILIIDELDKLSETNKTQSQVNQKDVQEALLKIVEGTIASVPPQGGRKHPQQEMIQIDTSNILFICGGAFEGLENIIKDRIGKKSIGFGAEIQSSKDMDKYEVFEQILPQDLLKFGMIPEFIGRLPIIATLKELDRKALIKITTEPKNALVKQYKKLLEIDGVELEFEPDALEAIVDKAIERKTGARGLRSIIENVMTDIMYDIPSNEKIEKCIITKDTIQNNAKPKIIENPNKESKKKQRVQAEVKETA